MQPKDILDKNPKLAKRIDRANMIMKYSVVSMVIVTFILMVFIVIQLLSIQAQITASLEENKRVGSANHAKTQKYIKCIADTLLEPVDERRPADFDRCGIEGTTQKETASQASTSTSKATLPQESTGKTAQSNVPTTSDPPEDDTASVEEDKSLIDTILSLPTKLLNGGK